MGPEHVFITVLNRRWCVCCDFYQQKRDGLAWTYPGPCADDAPAAAKNRAAHDRVAAFSFERANPTGTNR